MSGMPSGRRGQQHNGRPTIGRQAETTTIGMEEDAEPKGYPNADRYHAETVHADETHDLTKVKKDGDKS